jgi:sphinganine-1-phosphate aldolase
VHSSASVLADGRRWREDEPGFVQGKAFGGIYYVPSGELSALHADMWKLYSSTNALYPGIFKGVRKFEAELIAMAVSLLRRPGAGDGGDNACALLTSGGTESILLAVITYRDYARKHRGIVEPEIIAGDTVHAALDKVCCASCRRSRRATTLA